MKIFLSLNGKKVTGHGSTRSSDTDIEIDVPSNHGVIKHPIVYQYENGQLVKDEVYQQQLIKEKEEQENKPTSEEKLALVQKAVDDLILGGML